MRATRGLVLVKPVETEEHFAGGKIILPADARSRLASYQCVVVDVGPPEICEDEDCQRVHEGHGNHPANTFGSWVTKLNGRRLSSWLERSREELERCDSAIFHHPIPASLVPGAWVLVKHRSYIPASETEDLYLVRQDAVEAVFRAPEE